MFNYNSILATIVRSPLRILVIILVLIFTTEVFVMLVLPYIMPDILGITGEAFFDAILLTLVCALPVWFVILAAKQAEQERVTMARESEALKAQQMMTLAQLATGVAHEIRNPLTSIKMLIQVNKDKFAEEGLPTDDLELVVHEIRRMERSVNSLLEYARPERSEFAKFTIQKIIRNTAQLIESRCSTQNIELVINLPEIPATIEGDSAQIQQLLLNLMLNALDAMPEGGKLTLEVSQSQETYEIIVRDTGTGIAPAVESRLFSPFVTTKDNGVGLGLGICKRIAEMHQGTLTGMNRQIRGAEFCLTLPITHDYSHANMESEQDSVDFQSGTEASCKVY